MAIRNTGSGGKGSSRNSSVSVILNAQDASPGSCPRGATSNPVSVRLEMVDDDGDVILNTSKGGFVCTAGKSTNAKFVARYDVTNCKDSVAPANTSKGNVSATATSSHGSLEVTRKVHCKN